MVHLLSSQDILRTAFEIRTFAVDIHHSLRVILPLTTMYKALIRKLQFQQEIFLIKCSTLAVMAYDILR